MPCDRRVPALLVLFLLYGARVDGTCSAYSRRLLGEPVSWQHVLTQSGWQANGAFLKILSITVKNVSALNQNVQISVHVNANDFKLLDWDGTDRGAQIRWRELDLTQAQTTHDMIATTHALSSTPLSREVTLAPSASATHAWIVEYRTPAGNNAAVSGALSASVEVFAAQSLPQEL